MDHALPPVESVADADVAVTASGESIDQLAGSYGVNRVSTTTLSKLFKLLSVMTVTTDGGTLVTQAPGVDDQRWAQAGVNEFEEVGGEGRMVFGPPSRGHNGSALGISTG